MIIPTTKSYKYNALRTIDKSGGCRVAGRAKFRHKDDTLSDLHTEFLYGASLMYTWFGFADATFGHVEPRKT